MQPAQPDTFIGPYTIWFGRDQFNAPFYFVKRAEEMFVPHFFTEFNLAVTTMWRFHDMLETGRAVEYA